MSAVFPFDPTEDATGYLPRIQITADRDGYDVMLLGDSAEAIDSLGSWLEHLAGKSATRELPTLVELAQIPPAQGYEEMVRVAIERIESTRLQKVVLSRSAIIRADARLDPLAVIDRMQEREPTCTIFSLPAGDARFVGASPELLVGKSGDLVRSNPLAGTISRTEDDIAGLVESIKNGEEHRLVVEDIVSLLRPLLAELHVPASPTVVTLRAVRHLGTEITGKVSGTGGLSVIDLLRVIHPTPAIGGVPRSDALTLITEIEIGSRGLFGGAVGWMDADGDGEWVLGIRGALIEEDRAIVRAGAGIVQGSDPHDEAIETRIKLLSILDALAPGCAALL
jgi:isochorismate synthase